MKNLILLLIPLLLLSSCGFFNNSWQGSFYKDGKTEGTPEYSQIFKDFTSCKDWLTKKATSNDKYTCNKNCKNITNTDMQECEVVVRNWTLNEGTITFDSYKE